ncbi:MAG: glycoside hydrolase family 20 zincin-like fold domain-containing protein [Spirochaetota bacterium]|mgnify:CR=1 FL=1
MKKIIGALICASLSFGVQVESGNTVIEISAAAISVIHGPVKIFEMDPYYTAKSTWGNCAKFGDALEAVSVDGSSAIQRTKKNAAIAGESRFTAAENGFTAEYSVTIASNTGAHFGVWDVYLTRSIFADAIVLHGGQLLPLRTSKWDTIEVERFSIRTAIGEWSFDLAASGPAKWLLRSTCDRGWGAEERKTFTLLNQMANIPAEGISVKLRIEAKFTPAPGYDPLLQQSEAAASSMKKILDRYRLNTGEMPVDAAKRADFYAQRIAALTADLAESRLDPRAGVIIPEPKRYVKKIGAYPIPKKADIACNTEHDAALELLTLDLARYGSTAARADISEKACAMRIGVPSKDASVAAACVRLGIDTNEFARAEGYAIAVTPSEILVAGSGPRGVLYGVQTLRQIIRPGKAGAEVPACSIVDWPDMQFRGYYLENTASASRDELFHLIRNVYSYYKANVLMVEINWLKYAWRSHPEVSATNAIALSELTAIADYAKKYKMRLIPAVFTYGKVGNLLKSHPDIAEDAAAAKIGKAGTYCPNNEASYSLIFDLMSEIIDATKCDAMHIGHDEISGMVACPVCKAMAPADLFANDVNKIHGFLAGKNVEAMIWGDFILETARWKGFTANSGHSSYGNFIVHPAADTIHKDVIICDWQYSASTNFPTLAHFAEKGFRVIGCSWYNDQNNYSLTKAVREIGQAGILVTDWGFLAVRSPSANALLGAVYSWNSATPEPSALPYDPQAVFAASVLNRDRSSQKFGASFTPVNLGSAANRMLIGDSNAWIGLSVRSDLTYLPKGDIRLLGIPYRIGDKGVVVAAANTKRGDAVSGKIGVNAKSKGLVFLHGVSVENPTVFKQIFGGYRVTYSDGTSVTVPITTENAVHWTSTTPRVNPWGSWKYQFAWNSTCAWEGITRRGEAVNLQAYEWINPRPNDTIISVEAQAKDLPGLMIGLVALTAVQ